MASAKRETWRDSSGRKWKLMALLAFRPPTPSCFACVKINSEAVNSPKSSSNNIMTLLLQLDSLNPLFSIIIMVFPHDRDTHLRLDINWWQFQNKEKINNFEEVWWLQVKRPTTRNCIDWQCSRGSQISAQIEIHHVIGLYIARDLFICQTNMRCSVGTAHIE